ncbi:hypothetical protein RI129_013173 [Pyrocoelia pectoralis]|uniref:Uncharacterized protein n=1 Tax=Pyrocoelia pectoralis TaxID=417401 RepID=A0AAN7V182_9COLE
MTYGASKSVFVCPFLITCYFVVINLVNGGTVAENYNEFRRTRFCNISSFRCDSGECIDEENLCDGVVHCKDGSDETRDCVNIIPCSSNFLFQCDYGACINKAQQCDGKYDCKDRSDESAIACAKSGNSKFSCKSGEWINADAVCDGIGHCKDSSDETVDVCENFNCPAYSYRCKYGACVMRTARCNGVIDCIDASDEKGCALYNPYVTARPATKCARYEFKCDSGECIHEGKICNGKRDCADGSDETFNFCAYRRCPFNTFTCDYGGCIPKTAECNKVTDCWDASDERNCSSHIDEESPSPDGDEGGCAIPKNPEHGEHQIAKFEKIAAYRTHVPDFSVLVTKCSAGYSPTPPKESAFSVCFSGKWAPALQHCTRTCPTIITSAQTECKYENKPLKSCNDAVHGTIALTPCADLSHSLMQICRNGEWDIPISRCLPSVSTNTSGTVINIFYIYKDKTKR